MVTSKFEGPVKNGFNGPKLGVGRIVASLRLLVIGHLDGVDDGNDVLARVTVGVASDHQQGRVGARQTGFFPQFTQGCVLGVFSGINKASWEGPRTGHWRVFPLDQEHTFAPANGGISGQGRVEPALASVACWHQEPNLRPRSW